MQLEAPNATSSNIPPNIEENADKQAWGSGVPLAPKQMRKQIPKVKLLPEFDSCSHKTNPSELKAVRTHAQRPNPSIQKQVPLHLKACINASPFSVSSVVLKAGWHEPTRKLCRLALFCRGDAHALEMKTFILQPFIQLQDWDLPWLPMNRSCLSHCILSGEAQAAWFWHGQALYTSDHGRAGSLSLGQPVHRLPSSSRPGSEKALKWHIDMPPLSKERRWELAKWTGVSEVYRDHLQAKGTRVENLHSREMKGERRPA